MLASASDAEPLSHMYNLRSLWLAGNPMTGSRHYRPDVLSYFSSSQARAMKLDGHMVTEEDLKKAKERAKDRNPRDTSRCVWYGHCVMSVAEHLLFFQGLPCTQLLS